MSNFQRCMVCHSYDFMDRHVCKPAWECRGEWEYDDGYWGTIHALDSETAAEKYAETYDCTGGEYAIIDRKIRNEVVIQVRKNEDSEVERFAIEAEAVPTYRAALLTKTSA